MPDSPTRLHSCLYRGTVWHRRSLPQHEFQYRLFMLYLDLSELDIVFRGRWFWSTRQSAPARFRRSDHLGDPQIPLDDAVRDLVESQTGSRPRGPVRLLTQLRYFGYFMNPVCFYYCFDDAGAVQSVVAEVNNTPWGEQHCYVIPWNGSGPSDAAAVQQDKVFHVSPFLPMDMQYHWRLGKPRERLSVGIENHRRGKREFFAELSLDRTEISARSLASVLLRHPFMTGKITAAIYWQALRLWWNGAAFHPHPRTLGDSSESPPVAIQTPSIH